MNLIHSPPTLQLPAETVSPSATVLGRQHAVVVLASLLGVLAWSYWPTLLRMADRWAHDPQYSHGFVVPIFAVLILAVRKTLWRKVIWQPTYWGMPLLLAGMVLRLVAGARALEPLDALSLFPTLAGLVLLVGGWSMARWAWPALMFLAFMVPLPYQIEIALSHPLRGIATRCSTWLLQVLGFPALYEGNVILIEDIRLGVIDACSGLGMLMTFFALATAMAFLLQAPLVDRLLLIVSAVPIAVLANVLRITSTGVAYVHADSETAYAIMHDLAGWLMMPIALVLLWGESWFLAHLFPAVAVPRPLALAFPNGPFAAASFPAPIPSPTLPVETHP